MHFLNPLLAWLVPLVTIPLIIHWLSSRFPKKFLFSSIHDIRKTLAGRSRIFRWRHLLMMLLRALALIALLLAFLKPIIASRATEENQKRRIILMVDHSLSMSHSENGTSARSRARAEVKRLLDSLEANDSFQLIRVGQSPKTAFTAFSTNKAAALKFLDQSPPPLTHADFRSANLLATELTKHEKTPLDIYYFSDFQRRNWADVSFDALPENAGLYFVSATENPERANRSISSLDLETGAVIAGGEAHLKARVANHSAKPWSGKIEAGFTPAHLREKQITLPPWSETDITFPVPVPSGGLLKLTASLPKDSLPTDDSRHLAVQVQEREEVVLLTGDEAETDTPAPLLFLATAVDPYGEEKGVYTPKHLSPAALTPASLAASSRIVASRLPALTDQQAATIVTFLRNGGGMILFLDGEADPANLAKIGKLAGEPLPLTPTEKLDSRHLPGGTMRVSSGDFRSRFLRLFEGVRRQNLAHLEFYDLYHASSTGNGKTLLSYTDGTPALTENNIGLGTLLICNFSAAETSSNLARQRLFPAWIHEMLLQLTTTATAAQEPFRIGDSISGETWATEALGRDLLSPSGKPTRTRTDTLGERVRLSFTATSPGFHTLPDAQNRDLLAFAVNTDPDQSDLRTMDPSILPDRAGTSHQQASFLGTTSDYQSLLRGKPIFHWFILAALAFLLLEGTLFKSSRKTTT
ncbi:MAG: vWA domain-containing protein [Luteolibacter sp.]